MGFAAAVVLSLLGVLAVEQLGTGSPDVPAAATAPVATMEEEPSAAPDTATTEATAEATEKETKETKLSIPSSGSGTFTTAGGGGELVGGSRRTLTYRVQVEDGIGRSVDEVAAEVEKILADPRGWTADGEVGFRRVSGDSSDFRVRLATAGTVDNICGQYGLDTGGEVNCNVGQDVMVNLKRWELATQYYADDVPAYRALIINHEVGHFLGHGHETCPGDGAPAPVMMQQIKGLHGCRTNVWPYDSEGRAITGPSVP
ncbi:DUF3152 domain-containing protein [Streptomyces sp. NPDC023723]|uniref:DUF3152 domain-containing protein n=1 Tax=Streptomyces sp. NPDC023723 TaxID=3154323 RepID=UPI0034026EDB